MNGLHHRDGFRLPGCVPGPGSGCYGSVARKRARTSSILIRLPTNYLSYTPTGRAQVLRYRFLHYIPHRMLTAPITQLLAICRQPDGSTRDKRQLPSNPLSPHPPKVRSPGIAIPTRFFAIPVIYRVSPPGLLFNRGVDPEWGSIL